MFYLWLGCGHSFAFYFPNLIHHGIARDFLVLDGEVFYLWMCTAVVEYEILHGAGEVRLLVDEVLQHRVIVVEAERFGRESHNSGREGESSLPALPSCLCLFERGFLDHFKNLTVQEYVESLGLQRDGVFCWDVEQLDHGTITIGLELLFQCLAHHDGAAAIDADNIDFVVCLLNDLFCLVQDFVSLDFEGRGDEFERGVVVFMGFVLQDVGVFLPRELHEAILTLEVVDDGINGVAIAIVRAADEVGFEMHVLRHWEFCRALADGDMQYAQGGEVVLVQWRILVTLVVGAKELVIAFQRKGGRDALRDDLHKVIDDIDHNFLLAYIDADMVLLAGELVGKSSGVLAAVV